MVKCNKGVIVIICLILNLLLVAGCQHSSDPVKILKQEDVMNIKEFETKDINLTSEQFELFNEYGETGDEQLLKDLSPIEIFKYYFYANEIQDYKTLYGLYIKGDIYKTPVFKEFSSIMNKEDIYNKNKIIMNQMKKNIKSLAQIRYDDNTAYIQITFEEENEFVKNSVLNFKLLKNSEDIWKVDWMPLQ